jgi:hypothetical protein
MPAFTIIWTKVIQDDDDLVLDEISIREAPSMPDAENAAREIHNCNDHILLKIYDRSLIGDHDPIELANEYFALTLKRMQASLELIKRPIRKRKKKKS